MMKLTNQAVFLTLVFACSNAFADVTFPVEDMLKWKNKSFEGKTDYSLDSSSPNNPMIVAISKGTASGLFLESKVNLEKTPWINWSWKVDQFPIVGDEKTKKGDDFVARIYIVVQNGWTFLSSRAISYVWSQQNEVDEVWANPYAGDKAIMLPVEFGSETGIVKTEKRNVRDDLKRLFGKDYKKIKAIAIMTDTDSSKSAARASYSGITFSAE